MEAVTHIKRTVLVACSAFHASDHRIDPERFSVTILESPQDLYTEASLISPDILLVGISDFSGGTPSLIGSIIKNIDEKVFEIIVSGPRTETVAIAACVDTGASAFVFEPLDPAAVELEFICASSRIAAVESVRQERDFFLQAVRNEEKLSSQLLEEHITLREAFQNIASVKRNLEKENRRLEKVARHDALSGLLNRASLNDRLSLEKQRLAETGDPLSGIMVDIDHFKNINDSFGHSTGDIVIKELGKCLKSHLRREDHAGRYGGEEFFVILPGSPLETCVAIAERIRESIRALKVKCGEETISVTASLGAAECRKDESIKSWIDRADSAMYKAKQLGRNRVMAADRP